MRTLGHAAPAALLVVLLAACGVTAGNPGGGPRPDRLTVYGSVQPLETGAYRPARIDVLDADGEEVAYAFSSTYGTYKITGLAPGDYRVSLAGKFSKRLALSSDTLVNFLLPLPAPPADLRFIELGPSDFCLLWTDRSGLEAGLRVASPRGPIDAPANSTGLRIYSPNVFLESEDYASAATSWNEKFAGDYGINTWNEYGESPTVPVTVPAYDTDQWSAVAPPAEPPVGTDAYRQKCLEAPRDATAATFVGR